MNDHATSAGVIGALLVGAGQAPPLRSACDRAANPPPCAGVISALLALSIAWTATAAAQPRTLTLARAVATAKAHAPELAQAAAAARAAQAEVEVATAPLWPDVEASASYERATRNVPGGGIGLDMSDAWSFGLDVSQLVYDFGQSLGRRRAAQAGARAARLSQSDGLRTVLAQVRRAYFTAAANKALVAVAQAALDNEERHYAQVAGFVEVGTRPAIDLAQAKIDVANARLALLRATAGYDGSRVELARAMGVSDDSFEVSDETLPALAFEDAPIPALIARAEASRPDFAALDQRIRAQEHARDASSAGYFPQLRVAAGAHEHGNLLDELAPNLRAGASLRWPLFPGGLTGAKVAQASARLAELHAERQTLLRQLRRDLARAQLALRTARGAQAATTEVVGLARERLRLAEGRYETGVGNLLDLADAQLSLRNAQADQVRADYELSAARVELLYALGD